MNIKPILRTAQKFVTDNSPGILTGLAVAGTVSTALLTAKASFEVGTLIANARERESDETPETALLVKTYWKHFIPATVSGAATVTCIVLANHVSSRRTAAITAAFKLTEELAEQYKAKVVETMGAKKEEMMRADLAKDRIEQRKNEWRDIVFVGGSEVMFFDEMSGRIFKSEKTKIDAAINEINYQINNYYHASLSEFYEKIGLPSTIYSDEVGWNSDELLDVKFAACLVDSDKPAISMAFRTSPIRGYDRCS